MAGSGGRRARHMLPGSFGERRHDRAARGSRVFRLDSAFSRTRGEPRRHRIWLGGGAARIVLFRLFAGFSYGVDCDDSPIARSRVFPTGRALSEILVANGRRRGRWCPPLQGGAPQRSSSPGRLSLVLAVVRRVAGAGHGGAARPRAGAGVASTESTAEKAPRFPTRLRFLAHARGAAAASHLARRWCSADCSFSAIRRLQLWGRLR